jgi:hypothetical protein
MNGLQDMQAAEQAARTAALEECAAWSVYRLRLELKKWRERYRLDGPTHEAVAHCEVIVQLLGAQGFVD